MMQNKVVIGITGGIGSGKTSICKALEQSGITVIYADDVARKTMDKGTTAFDETVDFFGGGILGDDGSIDRKKLARIVFNDLGLLQKLNELTHKHIRLDIIKEIQKSTTNIVIVEAALIIESGMGKDCDGIIAIIAKNDLRLSRMVNRDGMTEQDAVARFNSQKSNEFYATNSDYVVYNESDLDTAIKETIGIITNVEKSLQG